MAAGVGSRLGNFIDDQPKCLIKAGHETLISRIVRILKSRGITDITIVTGHKSQLVHDELGPDFNYFHNPFFRVTNSIASLWLAKELLVDDVMLMNADLYFEEAVIDLALAQSKPAVMLSDCTRIEDADFCFKVDGERIIKTGNQLDACDIDCEYVGIARIDRCFIDDFKARLEEMVRRGDFNNWWEGVLYSFIEQDKTISHSDVDGAFWTEIDHLGDYKRLQGWLSKQDQQQAGKTGN